MLDLIMCKFTRNHQRPNEWQFWINRIRFYVLHICDMTSNRKIYHQFCTVCNRIDQIIYIWIECRENWQFVNWMNCYQICKENRTRNRIGTSEKYSNRMKRAAIALSRLHVQCITIKSNRMRRKYRLSWVWIICCKSKPGLRDNYDRFDYYLSLHINWFGFCNGHWALWNP